jgi:hypothetical protein
MTEHCAPAELSNGRFYKAKADPRAESCVQAFSAGNIADRFSLAGAERVIRSLHFPHNLMPEFTQYISERPEMTSQRGAKEGQNNKQKEIKI